MYKTTQLLLLDQLIKWGIYYHMIPTIHTPILTTTLVLNQGITLGWMSYIPSTLIILLQISALWIIMLQPLPIGIRRLCLAGGISNIIDRIFAGGVIDYLQFHFMGWQWPAVINLADLYLCAALFYWFFTMNKEDSDKTSILAKGTLQSD